MINDTLMRLLQYFQAIDKSWPGTIIMTILHVEINNHVIKTYTCIVSSQQTKWSTM